MRHVFPKYCIHFGQKSTRRNEFNGFWFNTINNTHMLSSVCFVFVIFFDSNYSRVAWLKQLSKWNPTTKWTESNYYRTIIKTVKMKNSRQLKQYRRFDVNITSCNREFQSEYVDWPISQYSITDELVLIEKLEVPFAICGTHIHWKSLSKY